MKTTATIGALVAAMVAICPARPFGTTSAEDDADQTSTTVVHKDGTYTTTQRDGNTRTLVRETKRKSGTVVMRSEFSLDQFGRERKGRVFDGVGNLLFISEFVYDGASLIEERVYDARGKIVRRLLYQVKAASVDGRESRPIVIPYRDGRPMSELVAMDNPDVFSTTSTHAHDSSSSPGQVVRSADGSSVRLSGGAVQYPGTRRDTGTARSGSRGASGAGEPEPERRRLRLFKRFRD